MNIVNSPAINETSEIGIESVSITYIQSSDTNDPSTEDQAITISSEYVPVSDENLESNFYFRIKTDNWAIDREEDLVKVIKDFKKRLFNK